MGALLLFGVLAMPHDRHARGSSTSVGRKRIEAEAGGWRERGPAMAHRARRAPYARASRGQHRFSREPGRPNRTALRLR